MRSRGGRRSAPPLEYRTQQLYEAVGGELPAFFANLRVQGSTVRTVYGGQLAVPPGSAEFSLGSGFSPAPVTTLEEAERRHIVRALRQTEQRIAGPKDGRWRWG